METLPPTEVLRRRGLKQRWIAKQLDMDESQLSRLVRNTGEYRWTDELKRLFALAVGWPQEAISFAQEPTPDVADTTLLAVPEEAA